MAYKTVVTNLGLAKIAAAIAAGSFVNLFEIALGDGNGNAAPPSSAATGLVREVHRAQLNNLTVDPQNPNYIVAEIVVPADVGGWTVRECGLYDNAGALIAICDFPPTYKPELSEGTSRDLVVRMIIEVSTAEVFSLVIDPAVVLASRQWVSDNFSLAVIFPGGTTGMILRKASNADGDTEWYDPTTGLNILVNTVEELQTLAGAQTIVNLAVAGTAGAAYYIDGVRLNPDEYTVNNATRITLDTPAAGGEKILIVQNDPLSSFSFLAVGGNLAEIAAAGPVAQAAAVENLGLGENEDLLTAIRANVFGALYPVGEILITRRAGNPVDWLGFGTWERYGQGRVIAGYDPTNAKFNALDQTGGAETHTLVLNEIPSHGHKVNPPNATTTSSGAHSHDLVSDSGSGVWNSLGGTGASVSGAAIGGTGTFTRPKIVTTNTGNHTHAIDIPEFDSGTSGGGVAHNNLQPYIVAFMWKRSA